MDHKQFFGSPHFHFSPHTLSGECREAQEGFGIDCLSRLTSILQVSLKPLRFDLFVHFCYILNKPCVFFCIFFHDGLDSGSHSWPSCLLFSVCSCYLAI